MRHWKLQHKLIAGFIILALIAGFMGTLGVVIALRLSQQEQALHTYGINSNYVQKIIANIHQQQATYYDALLHIEHVQHRTDCLSQASALDAQLGDYLNLVEENAIYQDSRDSIQTVRQDYVSGLQPPLELFTRAVEQGDQAQAMVAMEALTEPMEQLVEDVTKFIEERDERTRLINQSDQRTARLFVVLLIALTCVSFLAAVLLGLYLSRQLIRPIAKMVRAAESLAAGDIDVDVSVDANDEIGQLAQAFQKMVDGIREQADILITISSKGDFTVNAPIRSERDVANKALQTLIENCNYMMMEIRKTSLQVTSGVSQIAEGSQEMAEGSNEQAASISQFGNSLSELTEKTKMYAENSTKSQEANRRGVELLTQSNEAMNELLDAMRGIEESSRQITNIINVIEDIAFQTNILSLNAAVEAARAGQAGKGFAVVADEVRNLSGKSSQAARETAALIDRSFKRVLEGSAIATRASESLVAVEDCAKKATSLASEVASASISQRSAIDQINYEINQLSEIIHSNSATAEQSAAAAQQISAQSSVLDNILRYFKLREVESSTLRDAVERMGRSSPRETAPAITAISVDRRDGLPAPQFDRPISQMQLAAGDKY